MAEQKCKEKDIVRVCSKYGINSRQCKKKIAQCKK